ncbi:MAG: carbon storage regulator [Patescibacteria group bacterium]
MLVLYRPEGSVVFMGSAIVFVLDANARLGIIAPRDVDIVRGEVLLRVVEEELHVTGISREERGVLLHAQALLRDASAKPEALAAVCAQPELQELLHSTKAVERQQGAAV